MYSLIDQTSPFLKKYDYFNDSIDRSYVNENKNTTAKDIILEFLDGAFLIGATFLSFFLTEITNFLIFSYSINEEKTKLKYLMQYIYIQCFYYFFGFVFFFGIMKQYENYLYYDKREVKLKSIFYNFLRILYFFSAFIYFIPFSFLSYYPFVYLFNTIDINIFWEFYTKYLFYIPLIFYLNILYQLNMEILRHFNSFYFLFGLNIIIYWINLFAFSYIVSNKITMITYALILTNSLNLIISHFEIKRNVSYLKEISFFYYEESFQLKIENFFSFLKQSSIKGILFTLNYPEIFLIIFSSQLITSNLTSSENNQKKEYNPLDIFSLSSTLTLILISLPHFFIRSLSKFYKNHSENSVFDLSQKTKYRYLKFFWFMIFFFTIFFSFFILVFKEIFFKLLLNFSKDFLLINQNIYNWYNLLVKIYSIFIIFDSLGIAFEEIIKSLNEDMKFYLSFFKVISLIFLFFPLGFHIAKFFQIEIFWGFWIGVYTHMIIYNISLLIICYRICFNSFFLVFWFC